MMIDSLRPLYDSMLHNPLVYLSPDIHSEQELKENKITISSKTVIISDADMPDILQQMKTGSQKRLTDYEAPLTGIRLPDTIPEEVKIKVYSPSLIHLSVSSDRNQLLNFLQSKYTGWKVFVDGGECPVVRSNFMTMSVFVPRGYSDVTFVYENKPVIISGIISYLSFALVMIALSVIWIRENKQYLLVGVVWLILLGSALHYFFG
jgi:hypothetical protein